MDDSQSDLVPPSLRPRSGVRQWSVTLTQMPRSGLTDVAVRWREFPCRAEDWDGVVWARFQSDDAAVTDLEGFSALLSKALTCELHPDVLRSLRSPPQER